MVDSISEPCYEEESVKNLDWLCGKEALREKSTRSADSNPQRSV